MPEQHDAQSPTHGAPVRDAAGAAAGRDASPSPSGETPPRPVAAPAPDDERDWPRGRHGAASLAARLLVCLASTLTLLGGALALQQTRRAPAKPARPAATTERPAAQAPASENIDRPTSEPYAGSLSIFEDPKRAEKLQIERVMDVLGIKEGSGVADIGAGSGWFTVRAARRAGATGTVYAVEINRDYIKHIDERAKSEGLANVRTVLGKEDDPLLPEGSADAVLLLKTYHEIAEPVRLMRNLRRSLRAGALVGVIDRDGKGDDHGLKESVVVKEMARAGYALASRHDFVKPDGMDYFLVFRAKD